MAFGLGTGLLLQCASFFALGSPILDLLLRPLQRSISEILDRQLTNQIAAFVTTTVIRVIFVHKYLALEIFV